MNDVCLWPTNKMSDSRAPDDSHCNAVKKLAEAFSSRHAIDLSFVTLQTVFVRCVLST